MNKKEDILNAWITIEQLSEGSINKKDKSLKVLHTKNENWKEYFLDFITNQKKAKASQKKEKGIEDKVFKKSGIVLYFGIFNFQEVIDILRDRYKITKTHEDVDNSEKFTVALYFDNNLNILADKLFLTMSGYIREKGSLPENFLKVETSFREELSRKFDEDFNKTISELFQKYSVSRDNFRYTFLQNLDNDDINLHSFFIEDLKIAKVINSENLNRCFNGFSGHKKNLECNNESEYFNVDIFEDNVLRPKFYPLGRFPTNPSYALSFMQQVAVNLALNDENNIRSVNGPPGTGKTTLLKDIFADLVVQQALEISKLSNKSIHRIHVYWKDGKIGILPKSISDKNIIVASSNNGAVQNIVKELPKKTEIDKCFLNQLEEVDYFKDISNLKLTGEELGEKQNNKSEMIIEENWGVFSLEGGASSNISNLLLNIEEIEKDLNENYQSNANVYAEFSSLYNELKIKRDEVEEYSRQIYYLRKLKNKYEDKVNEIEKEKKKKQADLARQEKEAKEELERLRKEKINFEKDLSNNSIELENLKNEQIQAERNFNVINLQKPGLLWLQKIFNKSKVEQYFKSLNSANDHLNRLSLQKSKLVNVCRQFENQINGITDKNEFIQKQMQKRIADFERWENTKNNSLKNEAEEIESLEKIKSQRGIKEIDFSLSYEELQKSNPWFTEKFRILQSELFISALKVRKQFLYENIKSLKAAMNIWNNQYNYVGKENGQYLISEAWQWLNFTVPVISTTFASFGRMFKNLKENSISNLFIDEAGQALPQASVGAIFRSKKVMAVGDPSQITPVLTLDSNVLSLIARHYKVDEKFVSADASTQTIIDAASQYGFQKNDDEWIGIPLWVHRRSNYPMFTIANEISYDGLMVQGKKEDEAQGKSQWFDSAGKANDKYVKEQADLLKNLITERLKENPDLANEIYVISPFRNVAYKIARDLDEIKFTKRHKGKITNVGTTHTFQGKEAKIVYFVLGADYDSRGAANWAVSYPNIMNVAATRAKEEFYIIGDKNLYSSLGSKVANRTIEIINDYNKVNRT
ncbi:DEAD/DEAH box helicase [Clostridium intestinale]|uniref:ATP-binding protein n=1 Tax=Clostridium intestinale TaxID=36845 RepID=A0A7D6VXP0_9CLOT|nr:AAA domain-containing protein [Clostridium intestinale]QLY81792.1 ATP-binding protein [Clostridium intestinale]